MKQINYLKFVTLALFLTGYLSVSGQAAHFQSTDDDGGGGNVDCITWYRDANYRVYGVCNICGASGHSIVHKPNCTCVWYGSSGGSGSSGSGSSGSSSSGSSGNSNSADTSLFGYWGNPGSGIDPGSGQNPGGGSSDSYGGGGNNSPLSITTTNGEKILPELPKDCAGIIGGKAKLDDCGECVGGTTGKNPCTCTGLGICKVCGKPVKITSTNNCTVLCGGHSCNNFENRVSEVCATEGGFVNNPNDKGEVLQITVLRGKHGKVMLNLYLG